MAFCLSFKKGVLLSSNYSVQTGMDLVRIHTYREYHHDNYANMSILVET